MGLFIKAKHGQSKHEFVSVSAAGAALIASVDADECAIFVGPDDPANQQEVISALRQCRYHLRERSVPPADGAGSRSAAFNVAGAGQAAVESDTGAVALDDGDVAVVYGLNWPDDRASASVFLTNTVQQLSDVWLESVAKLS